ncbi:MAG: VanW family protein [Tissierellaceae bacterium]|nr:VanW family protein [Tissierellaceae bacterium]
MKKNICFALYIGFIFTFTHYIYARDSLECCTNLSVLKQSEEIEFILNKDNDNFDIPEISSQINNMPWKNDEDFLKEQEKYEAYVLLAGFCAVLRNPLPGEEYNVSLASKKIKGSVIKPSKIFSQNMSIGPYTKLRGFKEGASYIGENIIMTEGGGVCKIATTLYNLAVLSNLDIVERHNHSMPVNYVPYGQDATVAYGIKDFRFRNTTDNPILIWAEMIDNRLYMGFYGAEKPPKITWEHQISHLVEPSIKYVKNENLKSGEMKTVIEGMEGATVKTTITIWYKDEHYVIKNMGISQYTPLPKVIEIN